MTDDSTLLSEYDYELPRERIAIFPAARREISRMLIYDRRLETIQHRSFHEILDFIPTGDLLVLNDVRVWKARLWGKRTSGGQLEILIVHWEAKQKNSVELEVLIHPSRRVKAGDVILCGLGEGELVIQER
jgi:S-adenosylmethionine:tRNA ribosyltransferase-isomerase